MDLEDEISYQELQNQLLDPLVLPISKSIPVIPFDDSILQEYESQVNKSRYFTEKDPIKCHFCRKVGHVARECPAKEVACNLCQADHDPKKCPLSLICFSCYQRGHRKDECPSGRLIRKYCHCCKTASHSSYECDQIWRRYKFTENVPNKRISRFCYQCGEQGHFGDECTELSQRRYTAFSETALDNVFKDKKQSKSSSYYARYDEDDLEDYEDDIWTKKPKFSPYQETNNYNKHSRDSQHKKSKSFSPSTKPSSSASHFKGKSFSENNKKKESNSKYKGGYGQFKSATKPFKRY